MHWNIFAANPHPLFKRRGSVQFVIDLENPHEEIILFRGPRNVLLARVNRFGRAVVDFKPSKGQIAKIDRRRGKINVTDRQIAQASLEWDTAGR